MELNEPVKLFVYDIQTGVFLLTRLMDGWTIHNKVNISMRFNACLEESNLFTHSSLSGCQGGNMANKEEILSGLETAVVTGKKAESIRFANEVLSAGIKPLDAIDAGLIKGMMVVGEKYAAHTIFLPQVLLAADSMYGALDVLLPYIPKEDAAKRIDLVIGVVEGDVHDIGKNIVKTMFTAAGFNVHDIGKDVPPENFVEASKANNAQVVAMSTLMTPTMDSMQASVDALVEEGLKAKLKIIIGGAPTSQEFADEIGADMHAVNAQEAVAKVKGAL